MKSFKNINPIILSFYFIITAIIGIFNQNPALILIFFISSILLYIIGGFYSGKKTIIFSFIILISCLLLNPIFNHRGNTIIFFLNNNPVTVESTVYGLFMGIMLISSFYWFSIFTSMMTSDKIIYTVGKFSKKSALVITMTLRFIPMLVSTAKEINSSEKALGLYNDDTIISRLKGTKRVFSILLTNIIEKTIITAESMESRGYYCQKHTSYSLFKFDLFDIIFGIISTILLVFIAYVSAKSYFIFEFFPIIDKFSFTKISIIGYTCYCLLCVFPVFIEGGEKLRWRFLKSKISLLPIQSQTIN